MPDEGTTRGFWDPADRDTVQELDEFLSNRDLTRSEAVLDAIDIYLVVMRSLERTDAGEYLTDHKSRQAWLQSAIAEKASRE